MTTKKVYEKSIEKWKNNKGIGTLSYNTNLDLFIPIKIVLNKFFSFNSNNKAIVIVTDVKRREEWTTHLLTDFAHFDKIGKDQLKFLTADNIIVNKIKEDVELVIFDQIDNFLYGERRKILKGDYLKYKYILGVTNSPDPDDDTFQLYEFCPVIDRVTLVDVVTHGLIDGTVEYNIACKLNEDDTKLLQEYSDYVQSTLEIFNNDFDLINHCYMGDKMKGISADYFRNALAESKGWNIDIDTSTTYYANLDRYYNPNSLYERSKVFYDIIRKRRILLSDNNSKLNAIIEIVELNKDKKILIMNKRSDFANKVTNAINSKIIYNNLTKDKVIPTLFNNTDDKKGFTLQPTMLCVEYHPDVESRPLIDIETNDYFRYKSGINAGKTKTFGVTTINKIANERFTEGYHNVISATNAIPKEADLTIDFIIITSSDCETLDKFQYRVNRLLFKQNIKIINLYLENTKELDKFKEKQSLTRNKIINLEISGISEVNF